MGDQKVIEILALDQEIVGRRREPRTNGAGDPGEGQRLARHIGAQQDCGRLEGHGASVRGFALEQEPEMGTQGPLDAHPGGVFGRSECSAQ